MKKEHSRVSDSRITRSQSAHGNKNSTLNLTQQKFEAIILYQPVPQLTKHLEIE